MLIPFERTHLDQSWVNCETSKLLAQENGYMLSIRAHADFLRLIKSGRAFDGNGKKIGAKRLEALYDEITAVRSPWRGELLDAKFGNGTITYYSIQEDGCVKPITKNLKGLLEDRNPGISLDSWLKTANNLGLPTSRTKDGDLYYWSPRNGSIARFFADAGRAHLDCNGYPYYTNPSLGVRVARKK